MERASLRDFGRGDRNREPGRPDDTRELERGQAERREWRLECCDANLTREVSQLREIEATLRRSLRHIAYENCKFALAAETRADGRGEFVGFVVDGCWLVTL